ncbi:MAG: tetratricopeptide repeat protein [Anaerolineae bacterium]|nr:tetratricopeptide repeat protein [Anaerolineae bacterium]
MIITTISQLDHLINMGGGIVDTTSLSPEMQKALTLYFNGCQAMQSGYIAQAIEIYEKALSIWPNFVACHVNLANCLMYSERYDDALSILAYAHQFAPDDPDIHITAGQIFEMVGDKENELNQYKEALQDQPDHFQAMMNLGATYREIDEFEKSEQWLKKALEEIYLSEKITPHWTHPGKFGVFVNLALLYEDIGDFKKAIYCRQQCVSLDSSSQIRNCLKETEALASIKQKSRNQSEFVTNLLDRGVEKKKNGDYHKAKRLYEIAIKIEPTRRMSFYSMAKISYLMNERLTSIINYLRAGHLLIYDQVRAFSNPGLRLTIEQQLRQYPKDLLSDFHSVHQYAPLLLLDVDSSCHLAHALVDLDEEYSKPKQLLHYINNRYRVALAGKSGGLDDNIEDEYYFPIGVRFLLEHLQWEQIESPQVLKLYY